MSNEGENRRFYSPLIIALGAALLILLALVTAHYFPLLECPIKAQWNVDCPGCGGTRAAQSLIAGNLPRALSHNPLIASGIIIIAAYCLFSLICRVFTGKPSLITFSIYKGVTAILVIIVFTIVRNL
jgi:hypothetical protein